MTPVGFSTGCMYAAGKSIEHQIRLYKDIGANAIELMFGSQDELNGLTLSKEAKTCLRQYDFISLHAPFNNIRYGNNKESQEVINLLGEWCAQMPVRGIVLHPDTIDCYIPLQKSNLPFLIENIEYGKPFGTKPEHIMDIKSMCDFGFVFDTLHAYENSQGTALANQLISTMGNRLHHLHVSGSKPGERHIPVHLSSNKDEMIRMLNRVNGKPIILEGTITGNYSQTAARELAFITEYMK